MSDNKVRLTGLWEQESDTGAVYLVGNLSPSANLLILENQYKETHSDPSHIAFITNYQKKEEETQEKERQEALL